MLGKLKQRPTMASFPPWRPQSRACLGGLWGPLLFPVLAAGLLASAHGQEAGWASPPPPAGLALQAGVATPASRACSRPARPRPVLPGSARLSQGGKRDPVPLTSPSCRPHVLHHLRWGPVSAPKPLWPEHRAHRTEAQAGQGAVAGY